MQVFLPLRLSYLRVMNLRVTLVHLRFLSCTCPYPKSAASPCSSQPRTRCCPSQLGVHRQTSSGLVLPWFPPQQMRLNSLFSQLKLAQEGGQMSYEQCVLLTKVPEQELSNSSWTGAWEREESSWAETPQMPTEASFHTMEMKPSSQVGISRDLETSGFLLRKQSFLCFQTWSECTKNRNCQFKSGWEAIPLYLHSRQDKNSNSIKL